MFYLSSVIFTIYLTFDCLKPLRRILRLSLEPIPTEKNLCLIYWKLFKYFVLLLPTCFFIVVLYCIIASSLAFHIILNSNTTIVELLLFQIFEILHPSDSLQISKFTFTCYQLFVKRLYWIWFSIESWWNVAANNEESIFVRFFRFTGIFFRKI